jgi:hypothetical protein
VVLLPASWHLVPRVSLECKKLRFQTQVLLHILPVLKSLHHLSTITPRAHIIFSVISPTRSAAREVSPPPGATQKKAMPCQSQSYICTPSRLKRSHDARLHSYPIRYCTASNLRSKIRSFYYLLQGFVQTESWSVLLGASGLLRHQLSAPWCTKSMWELMTATALRKEPFST